MTTDMQSAELINTVQQVPELMQLLQVLRDLKVPNHNLAGGAVTQCVWNTQLGYSPLYQVKDFDVVYFDLEQKFAEKMYQSMINSRHSFSVPVDINKQANGHQWYGNKFGNEIESLIKS